MFRPRNGYGGDPDGGPGDVNAPGGVWRGNEPPPPPAFLPDVDDRDDLH